MEKDITLIFPMAGKGARFGYTFKPFLEVEGRGKFIELAVKPFEKWLPHIKNIIFVYLEEQEQEHNASNELEKIFVDIPFDICLLKEPTSGPAETIRLALENKNVDGPVVLCDCDHTLNVDEFFEKIIEGNSDCVLPVWPLRNEDVKSWSVVSITESGGITGIAEKELPSSPGEFFGVIGCYHIKDSSRIKDEKYHNVSDCIKDIIKSGENICAVKINEADFFGDPQRLEKTLKTGAKKAGTMFCDLDGTIILHEDSPSTLGIKILEGAQSKLKDWKSKGYYIVLTTARSPVNEDYLKGELARHNIPYDELIMGLSSGPRIVINDRKPSDFLKPSAMAFEVERNTGVGNLHISIPDVKVIQRMKGGSFADTLLIERDGRKYIRKTASKRKNLELGYVRLKKQHGELLRFGLFHKPLVPKIVREEENSFEYFFEMEYLEDYSLLSDCDSKLQIQAAEHLLTSLSEKVYKQKAFLQDGKSWLKQHFENKIYKNINPDSYPNKLEQLLRQDKILINGESYDNIHTILEQLSSWYSTVLAPKYLCPVHGDLTFENILCQDSFGLDVKIIDMDGAEYMDSMELDMGKMFQSIITNYEKWSKFSHNLVDASKDGLILNYSFDLESDCIDRYIKLWSKITEEDEEIIKSKAYFYTSLHLIRMMPFRLKASEDQAIFAFINSILLLSKVGK